MKCERLRVLSEEEIGDIFLGALETLEGTGVRVREQQVAKELVQAGCALKEERVRIPSHVVQEALRRVPPGFTLHGRDPEVKARIQGSAVWFQPMIGRLNILDSLTGRKRRTNLADVADLVRLADALPHYILLHSGAIMPHIEGVPDRLSHVHGYYASVKNSAKIIKGTCRGRRKAADCIQMASLLAGGEGALRERPNLYSTYNVLSPLEHGQEMLQGLAEYVKLRLPLDITAEPQMGATSPVTLAGTLAQQTAELLSGVVITQVLSPGTPIFIGTCGAAMDMRYGTIALGGVEAALLNVAHAQIARFLHIPSRGTGSNTQSKIIDFQAGYEKAFTLLLPVLAGIDMIFYPGTIEHAETISLESLLLDHELCGIALRARSGVVVDESSLAIELIHKATASGHFLSERHTSERLQSEHHYPQLADRRRREDWESSGAKDAFQTAGERVRQLLAEHKPLPLAESVEQELLRYIAEVERRESE